MYSSGGRRPPSPSSTSVPRSRPASSLPLAWSTTPLSLNFESLSLVPLPKHMQLQQQQVSQRGGLTLWALGEIRRNKI